MSATEQTLPMNALQDLFYRSKFGDLLKALEAQEEGGVSLDSERALLKANTLFELHRVADAKKYLKSVSQQKDSFDEAYLYSAARLCYFDSASTQARALFTEIAENSSDRNYRFKALLGIANTYYTEGEYGKIPAIISELHAFEPLTREDEKISFLIFLGNYYFVSGASSELAKQYFKKALSTAASLTWTYFITRSLYGISCVCEKDGQTQELLWTLDILQSFVDQSEQLFFSFVVNNRFKQHFSINIPMEFDNANKRILVKNKWLGFHDKPLLFQFLLKLHEKADFINKETLATELWPEETYKPRIHDPRIFDIAKRARNLIEAYENQPIVLLSGRMGYKLAST
jgi:hypothetical protein